MKYSKIKYPLLRLSRYLFGGVSGERYVARGCKENILCVAISGNVTVSRFVLPVVVIPLLDFVMIY